MKRSSLFVLLLTVFIDLLGFGIVVPFLAYYAQEYGASGWIAGLLLASYSLMQFLFAPIWGRLSDRIGRRPVMLISLSGGVIGYSLFAMAESLTLLFVARIIAGIAAANIGIAQAYIADSTSLENRAKGMGLIGAAFGLGFIFGPPFGGLLSRFGTERGLEPNLFPGIAAAMLSAIALAVAFSALRESKPPDLQPRSGPLPHLDSQVWSMIFRHPLLPMVFGCLTLIIVAFSGMEPIVTLHAANQFRFTPYELGMFFAFMGIVVAVVQGGLIGRITRTFGEPRTVVIGAASLALGLLIIPLIGQPGYLYAAALLIALGQGLCYPSLTSMVSKASPPEQMGSMLGISSSLGSLSRVIGPLLAGTLYDRMGPRGGFWGEALVVLVALVLALQISRAVRQARERQSSIQSTTV
jgi:MFS transporter, DHA1 family, tetracycline resistance protein